jgi:hypothetical protein
MAVESLNSRTEGYPPHTALPGHTADTVKLLDSLYRYFWRTNIGYWVNEDLDLFAYDRNTDLIRWNRKHWDESYGYMWYDDFRVLYTLEGGLPVEELRQEYDLQTCQWIDYTLFNYVYDGQGNRTEWKWKRWSAELNDWINFRLNNYYFDENGQQTLSVSSIWDAGVSEWLFSQKKEIFYDSNGADTLILTSNWSFSDSVWVYLSRRRNFYDQAGNRVGEQMQFWDAVSSAWINSINNTYLFDELNRLKQATYQHWNANLNTWIDANLTEYSYNEMDLTGLYVTSFWDPSDSAWIFSSRGLYEYDRDGDETDLVLQVWDQQGEWINQSRMHYVYYKLLSLQEPGPPSAISCFWTILSDEYQCFQCNGLNSSQSYVLNMYSMQGSLILKKAFNGDQAVTSWGSIPPGIYIITVTGKDQVLYWKKMMIP